MVTPWKAKRSRPRMRVLLASGIAAILGLMVLAILIVPPRTIIRIVAITSPYAQLIGFIATLFTVIFAIVKFRGILFKIFDGQQDTRQQSKAAADNSLAAGDALVLMTEAFVEERKVLEATQEARDREAARSDELVARTIRTLAMYEQQHVLDRLGRLERPVPEEVAVITGKHRLPTSRVPVITSEGVAQESRAED